MAHPEGESTIRIAPAAVIQMAVDWESAPPAHAAVSRTCSASRRRCLTVCLSARMGRLYRVFPNFLVTSRRPQLIRMFINTRYFPRYWGREYRALYATLKRIIRSGPTAGQMRCKVMRVSKRLLLFATLSLPALACVPAGTTGLTAVLVNPTTTVTGTIDASGCDIGVFYNAGKGTVSKAAISGALYFAVYVDGDVGSVSVDVLNSNIHDIGDHPLNGDQRGVGIYFRAYLPGGSATGKISGNTIWNYQKEIG